MGGSGWTTPLSSSTTLSSPPSPRLEKVDENPYNNPRLQASHIIEHIASRSGSSSSVYIYDVAEQVGFGTLTKEWLRAGAQGIVPVVDLQTRAGAGLSLIGRLSQGTSSEAGRGAVLTAYTTPGGLALMAPSFAYLPPPSVSSRLVVQVPAVTTTGDTLTLSATLSPLASIWTLLPEGVVVLLSSTPQQSVDFAALSYRLTNSHIIHIFDHFSCSREFGHAISKPADLEHNGQSVADAVRQGGYTFFEYTGDNEAHTAVVLLNGPLSLAARRIVTTGRSKGIGVVTVNVLRPWDESALRSILPSTVRSVHVIDDVPNVVTQGNLYSEVFSALWNGGIKRSVHAHRLTPAQTQEYFNNKDSFARFLRHIAPFSFDDSHESASSAMRTILLFGTPASSLSPLPQVLEDFFLISKNISSRLLTDFDVFSRQGGVFASRLLLSSRVDDKEPVPIPFALPLGHFSSGQADFLAVLDQGLLKTHSILKHAKLRSTVLIATSWTPAEFFANIPADLAFTVHEHDLRVFIIDAKTISSKLAGAAGPVNDAVQNLLLFLAFLRLYLGATASEDTILKIAQSSFEDAVYGIPLVKINSHAWSNLYPVILADSISNVPPPSSQLKDFEVNAIAVGTGNGEIVVNGARLGSWHDAAKHLLFPTVYSDTEEVTDSYQQNPALRPEIPDRTYLVTCTVNKRLTPLEYDRNVFHLEFDTSGTGLKYAIGEALGVHGWNDEQEVLEFCEWYGVDPDRLITIPVPNDEGKVHTRTVLQALQQQVDLFGKPPKSFYSDLAEFATSEVEKYALRFIASPEGSATFKKMSEKDTVTFANVLRKYSSAKPGIERLCELIEDIKPRHYSIASSQSVVGNRVDLLVVTVDWLTPSGTPRYGQCTRYLAGLRVGQKVTVSIKPSVMKLPPNPKQPIIMAGLGTGAAPFRAFLQHLAWLAQKGEEIGPVYYYFGSRYEASEYLYGEEVQAFILDGVITRAGLAFSRDGPKKVYIQHKMLEDSEALAKMLYDDNGVFYLCGPTWPVPDVYEALVNAFVKYKGTDPVKAGEYLESLKEDERYVLEVY